MQHTIYYTARQMIKKKKKEKMEKRQQTDEKMESNVWTSASTMGKQMRTQANGTTAILA